MFKKVAFTMYPVENMERARKFYEETLKLKAGSVSSTGKWVEYDLPGGGCLAITMASDDFKPSSTAGGSLAFETENLGAVMAELKKKDVKISVDAFDTPVCKMAVILDSEGNALLLHELRHQTLPHNA